MMRDRESRSVSNLALRARSSTVEVPLWARASAAACCRSKTSSAWPAKSSPSHVIVSPPENRASSYTYSTHHALLACSLSLQLRRLVLLISALLQRAGCEERPTGERFKWLFKRDATIGPVVN